MKGYNFLSEGGYLLQTLMAGSVQNNNYVRTKLNDAHYTNMGRSRDIEKII